MFVPVLAFATNILLTMRGGVARLFHDVPLRFMATGFFFYILVSFQGSLQALRSTNAYTHFSQWPVGHAHLALLGGFGFLSVGVGYWLANNLTEKRMYSDYLMRITYWIMTTGFLIFFAGMTIAGLVANSAWWIHMGIAPVLPMLKVHFIVRAVGGGMVFIGACLFSINVLLTFFMAAEAHDFARDEGLEAPTSELDHSKFMRHSQQHINLPVIIFGGLAVFTLMTFMVVAMPYMMGGAKKPTERAHFIQGKEAQGQALYKSLGCFYCHNQFTRPRDWAMGPEVSRKGDFYFSTPHFLGTERTGPNLAMIGGKRPTEWHHVHDRSPRMVSPASIMPDFPFLTDDQVDALVAYVQNLGSYDLEPQAFQPSVPAEYQGKENPNMKFMMAANKGYDAASDKYTGDLEMGDAYARIHNEGKTAYSQKCLPCHGGSGNGQGPYARQVLTRPANLHERITHFPNDSYHFWRVSEGVPGTHMPPWGHSLSEAMIWKINTFEMSFALGSFRTKSVKETDAMAQGFADRTGITPGIAGTVEDYTFGKRIYELYCLQCHGEEGHGDGPASIKSDYGYIRPQPADLWDPSANFTKYGQYVWQVREGVEATNMPVWKEVLNDLEISRVIFYVQGFSKPEDYNARWAPLYSASFAKDLKNKGGVQ
jgi:cytochrome c oxidase cbb3-type subunit I/II